MNRKMKQEKLAKQISLALMAGMVTYTPVAFGMPVQDGTAAGVHVNTPDTVTMNITGDNQNNVINWIDFSIGKTETVNFDNNNYANIVTGSATSFIDGHMNGGGDIYLINPNGVIFGKDAQVNVGNLYVSTQGKVDTSKFNDQEANPVLSVSGTPACDVVNLGTIKADTVEVVGNNIRFLNAAQLQVKDPESTTPLTGSNVKVTANGYIHVGHEGSVTVSGYDANKTITEYQLVHNLSQLHAMSGSNNYMLADDINKEATTPTEFESVESFSGKFDGMFYTVNNLKITSGTNGQGLFASTSGATIENVGLVNVNVTGSENDEEHGAGGIVGTAQSTTLRNVYTTGGTVTGDNPFVGGLVGTVTGAVTIDTAYNDNKVINGAGILGYVDTDTWDLTIKDTYNTGTIQGDTQYGFIAFNNGDEAGHKAHFSNIYNTAGTQFTATPLPGMENKYDVTALSDTSNPVSQKRYYSSWDISDVGGVTIDPDTGNVTKTKWRIYAGQSLPMLTAFFKGTVQASYDFSMGDVSGSNLDKKAFADYSTNKYYTENTVVSGSKYVARTTGPQYDGNVVTTYNANAVTLSDIKMLGDDKLTTDDYTVHPKDQTATRSTKSSVATFSDSYSLFSSGQLGYDIAGSNFTIEKRKVTVDGSASVNPEKTYDGTGYTDDVTFTASGISGIAGKDSGLLKLSGDGTGYFFASAADRTEFLALPEAQRKTTGETYTVKAVGENYFVYLDLSDISLDKKDGLSPEDQAKAAAALNNYDTYIDLPEEAKMSQNGIITPRSLYLKTKSGETALDKVYDGTTDVNATYNTSNKNIIIDTSKGDSVLSGDEISIVGTDDVVFFTDKNAGDAKKVAYTGIRISGDDDTVKNYQIVDEDGNVVYRTFNGTIMPAVGVEDGATVNVTAKITPKTIDMNSAVNAVTKEYDGNSTYEGTISINTSSGEIITGDSIAFTIVGNKGTFMKADGTTETVHAGGNDAAAKVSYTLKVTGDDAPNYKIGTTTLEDNKTVPGVVSVGTITKKTLQVTYDAGTPATLLERTYNGESTVADGTTITADNVKNRITVTGWVDGDASKTENTVVNTADYVNSGVADAHVAMSGGSVTTKDVLYKLNNLDDYTYSGTGVVSGTDYTTLTVANAGKVTQKALTVNFGEQTKQYDGTIAVTQPITGTLDGFVNESDRDTITLDVTGASGTYNNGSDVAGYADGTDKVTYTGVTLTGTNNDYSLPVDMKGNGTITARVLHNDSNDFGVDWDALNPIIKTYDGNDKVKGATGYESEVYGTNAVTSTNFIDKLYAAGVSGDGPIAFKVASAVYDTKHAGEGKPVTYNLTIDKSQFSSNSNYDVNGITGDTISITKETTGKITPKEITASISNTHTTKTYDGDAKVKNGDTEVTGNNLVTLDGLISEDANNSTAAYHYVGTGVNTETKNATQNSVNGANKIVYTIAINDGNKGDNYVVKDSAGNTVTQLTGDGVINKAGLSLAFAAPTKDYDTTTTATVAVTPTGLKGSDTFTAASVTGTYGKGTTANWEADANAGTDKLVKYTGIDTALGDNYGNYNVTYGTETVVNGVAYSAGTINKLNLTSGMITSNIDSVTKTYDGTANVNHFDGSTTKTASDYFGLTVKINGTDYIWKNSADKTYFKTVTGAYQDSTPGAGDAKNAGGDKSVTYAVELADDLAANINLDSAALSDKLTSTNNTITKRQVGTVTAAPATGTSIDKVYDGNDSVDASTVSLTYDHNANINTSTTGILADDYAAGVTVSTTGSKYTTSDANWDPTQASTHDGSNKVQISLALNDTSGNYALANTPAVIDGNIQKKALTVSVKDSADFDKTYDATANLKNAATSYLDLNTAGQMVGTDTATLTGASGSYDSANAGNRTVTFNDFAIDNNNYYVSTTSLQGSGTIAQKVIDAGKVKADGGALSKVYDGSTDATAAIVGKTLTSEGFITGDDVSLTATGAEYSAATVAGATTVTYSGVSLGGASAANYKIDSTTLTGDGTITPKTVHAAATGSVTGKTYDGQELSLADLNIQLNQDDIVTKTGASTKDDVTLTGTISATKGGSAVTKIKDAGDYVLSYDGFELDGTDKSNYNLVMNTSTLPQNITIAKRMLTADIANGAYREYEAGNNNTNNVNVKLSGFVADSDYSVTADDKVTTIVGTYGKWDATNGFTGDNNVSRSTTTTNYVPVEGKNYGYKAINYDGFANAVVNALGTASAAAAENYYVGNVTGNNGAAASTMTKDTTGLVQTAYFKEAAKMGYLTPISITAASIKEKWSDVEKVYDGTTSVNNPLEKFTLYYDANGNNQQDANEGSIAYKIAEGGSTVYNSADVATANTVTYRGVKVDENTALTDNPNYEMASDIFDKYNGAIDDTHAIVTDGTTKVAINKRGLIVQPTTNAPSKVYDGTDTVINPSNYVELVTTKSGDTGVIDGDNVLLNTSGITGKYDTADGGENKEVTYSGLALTGTKAGNYKVIKADGNETTTVTDTGKITPREIEVAIKNRDVQKVYDSTSNVLKDNDNVTVNQAFQYSTDAADTDGKNLVTATVTGGQITYDTANNKIIYTPTAGTGVVEVQLEKATFTKDGTATANAGTGLGIDYVLSYDPKNIVLVHTTADGDKISLTPAENSRMSATLRGDNIGTITQREIKLTNIYAEKIYDGTDAVKGLNGDSITVHDMHKNVDFAQGKLLGDDTVNGLGINVTGGTYDDPNAADDETQDKKNHTVSGVTFTINNGNYKLADNQPTDGTGVITRKTITANPTAVKTAPGETPTFSGSFSGFVGDDGAQAAQDFEWKSDSYPAMINEKGSYEVYAWYRDKDCTSGNYGKNYTFSTPANTAWTVGYTDPLDPSNPDSPFNPDNPMYPSKPDSPLNPNSGVGQAIAQASKFKPDDKSYNRASHDDNIEHFGQQSAISIQYEDAGVNVGDEEAVVGKRSLIGIESAGNVVNLGDAEMRAGNIGIENNGTNLGSAAEQAAIEAGLPATESYEAVPAVATAEQEDAVVESPFLSRLRQGQSAASDESEGEVSTGISIITAEPEDEDEEEKKNRAALMARSDRETHIGIETIGGGVNMAAAVR
ncbi:YDG domain-containing protein [Schwartzia succinivorans]|jgi:filamentous hemagglutinin family protein|uniref:Filamentous hemagglutinin family N-terminal domain-containing protein n=1 Tax=Schwartzia succinivorans DSM 10502 TaxID=1123243 RepID=A0A1M4UYD7_9FIRM|nr:YDG domain-containing protein [Schwartzia succinivorans]SHE61643.1 filamentous hemagglutinin family N-terminal domain-containing protein [Schwartzia succinivorans DSM 10502]